MIAGKSVVAFRQEDENEEPSAKYFGYVQTDDEKPRRRLWELLKSQGMQENQQLVFMSDSGENVRRVQEYLHPFSEHLIDWFHITMRLTVLQQQTKALQTERPQLGDEASEQLESFKHLLWHGNVEEALERLGYLILDLDLIRAHSAAAAKITDGLIEFETYIRINQPFIPNFGERRRQGEAISTAFVESTINQVVSRRFVKKPANELDAPRCPPAAPDKNQDPERGVRGGVSPMVSAVPCSGGLNLQVPDCGSRKCKRGREEPGNGLGSVSESACLGRDLPAGRISGSAEISLHIACAHVGGVVPKQSEKSCGRL